MFFHTLSKCFSCLPNVRLGTRNLVNNFCLLVSWDRVLRVHKICLRVLVGLKNVRMFKGCSTLWTALIPINQFCGTNHRIDWDNTTVIDRHAFTHPRCTIESWHIHKEEDALNREKGLLPDVYLTLQSSHKFDTQLTKCV